MCLGDETIIAVASDGPLAVELRLPLLDLNNHLQIVDFVYHNLFGEAAHRAQKPE
jgi:hypothetical protein